MTFQNKLNRALTENDIDIFGTDAADDWGYPRFEVGDWARLHPDWGPVPVDEAVCFVFGGNTTQAFVWWGDSDFPTTSYPQHRALELIPQMYVSVAKMPPSNRNPKIRVRPEIGRFVTVDKKLGMVTHTESRIMVWFGDTIKSLAAGTVPKVYIVEAERLEPVRTSHGN